MNLVLFGPPGAGKGTQAQKLCETFHLTHLSTGDQIRAAIRAGTEWGKNFNELVARGELIGDEVVTELADEVIRKARPTTDSFLFDGYPRTLAQIDHLENLCDKYNLDSPAVVTLDVPEEDLLLRITGRRICPECRKSFNIHLMKDVDAHRCDGCAERLLQRPDDNAESVKERLRVYHEQTYPVIQHYENQGRLNVVTGIGTTEEVFESIYTVLKEFY